MKGWHALISHSILTNLSFPKNLRFGGGVENIKMFLKLADTTIQSVFDYSLVVEKLLRYSGTFITAFINLTWQIIWISKGRKLIKWGDSPAYRCHTHKFCTVVDYLLKL